MEPRNKPPRLSIRPTHQSIPPRTPVEAILGIKAPAIRGPNKPSEWTFLLDRSASMADGRLERAKNALLAAVRSMDARDTVRVIPFDDVVDPVLGPIHPEDVALLEASIARVEPRSSTDIYSPLARAYRETAPGGNVILLTDGHHNHGGVQGVEPFHALAEASRANRITTSALGIGEDFEEVLLTTIAHAGEGTCEYLRYDAEIPQALQDALTASQNVVGADLHATLTPAPGFRGVVYDPGATRTSDGSWSVPLGSLRSGATRRVAVSVIPERPMRGVLDVATINFTYTDPDDATQRTLQEPLRIGFTQDSIADPAGQDLDALVRFQLLTGAHMGLIAHELEQDGRGREAMRVWQDRLQQLTALSPEAQSHPLIQDDLDDVNKKIQYSDNESPEDTKRTYFKHHATLEDDDEKMRKYRDYKN